MLTHLIRPATCRHRRLRTSLRWHSHPCTTSCHRILPINAPPQSKTGRKRPVLMHELHCKNAQSELIGDPG
ncbi:hypothetical protein CKO_01802 [Citrobacter koseri ATCC BAA-895]|uniref:Uncharacterized protein n=1 Tax=Citrobacter koseri (strain ATCC BAA-895 / CDC 4225-83 / SGSC4696) TaxID=290338 RepID=A8AHG9_CITK8|nr:hypothetical protein CKO_01802 [Citrobacter koseri ATCC BAA-895]